MENKKMIHFQTNPNLFYFNITDLTNNCLFIQDQADYGFVGQKTVLYICQVVYSADVENQSSYNNIENSRYLAIQQNNINNNTYQIITKNQLTDDLKSITVSYQNKKNSIDLTSFVESNYIQSDKIYSVLLRDAEIEINDSVQVNTDNNDQVENITEDTTIKIYQFHNSDLDQNHKIILNYSDLGINTNVNIVIENSSGNIIDNNNFVNWKWENSYLIIQFQDFENNVLSNQNLTDTWRIKYLINDNIRSNLKSQLKQHVIFLNGNNITNNEYSVVYDGSKVYINHNSNNYIMGMLYNADKQQVYIPINYTNMNQIWIDFESIPNTFDDGQTVGEYLPTPQKQYIFIMFVTKYYLIDLNKNSNNNSNSNNSNSINHNDNLFESNELEIINNEEQYYPATKIKLNQLKDNDRANFIIDKLITPSIVQFRQIRIYNERAVRLDEYHYKVTYQNMLNDTIQVFMNGSKIPLDKSQYTVDLEYSIFKFNIRTTIRDSFEITYSFDYFPSVVLYGFLQRAVSELNVGPVGMPTSYTFETAPQFYNGLIANFAYVFCLDKLILDYNLWKGRLVFALPPQALADGNGDIISQLQSLRGNAWQRISLALNNAKLKAPQYLAHPTALYYQGISPLGRYSGASGKGFNGGKLRGLKINRYGGSF